MQWTAWATLAALAMYIWVSLNVGKARGTYNVKAPLMDGPEEFLRVLRVQGNTVEQLLLLLPAMWMCAFFLSDRWAALGGAVWVVGRAIYAKSYYQDPAKRTLGFMLTFGASVMLMLGTAVGLITY